MVVYATVVAGWYRTVSRFALCAYFGRIEPRKRVVGAAGARALWIRRVRKRDFRPSSVSERSPKRCTKRLGNRIEILERF